MSRTQKICVLFAKISSFVGLIAMLISLAWRWIYVARGDRYIGSTPFILFWIGAAMLFAGLFIIIALKRIQGKRDQKTF